MKDRPINCRYSLQLIFWDLYQLGIFQLKFTVIVHEKCYVMYYECTNDSFHYLRFLSLWLSIFVFSSLFFIILCLFLLFFFSFIFKHDSPQYWLIIFSSIISWHGCWQLRVDLYYSIIRVFIFSLLFYVNIVFAIMKYLNRCFRYLSRRCTSVKCVFPSLEFSSYILVKIFSLCIFKIIEHILCLYCELNSFSKCDCLWKYWIQTRV